MSIVHGGVRGVVICTWMFLEGLESQLFKVGMRRSLKIKRSVTRLARLFRRIPCPGRATFYLGESTVLYSGIGTRTRQSISHGPLRAKALGPSADHP
jgi:hypothetical protein